MRAEQKLYVRSVDGVRCFVPLPVSVGTDGTFHLLPNTEFDPEDAITLFEFLPGDDVRAEHQVIGDGRESVLLATTLVQSASRDRAYWAVLFAVAWGVPLPSSVEADELPGIAARIRAENESGLRSHYPSVVEWARKQA